MISIICLGQNLIESNRDIVSYNKIKMNEVWSTNRYILLILSFTFPDGVYQKIFNYMKEAKFEDSRKEHMMDCVLHRIENKIGPIVKDLIPPAKLVCGRYWFRTNRLMYHEETLRHVDHGIHNINLIREYYKSLPRPSILRRREELYPSINCMNEHDIPLKYSWTTTWCVAYRILDNILERKEATWENIRSLYPDFWRRTCSQGEQVEYQNYNGIIHYPVRKTNEYIHKDKIMREIKKTRTRERRLIQKIRRKRLPKLFQMKVDQKLKRKFKKNDSYLFKKNHFKNHKNVKSRKYGLLSAGRRL